MTTDLNERYGTGRRSRTDRRLAWILAAAIGALVLFFVWNALFVSNTSSISVRDISHTIEGSDSATLTFGVTAPVNSEVQCAIEALSKTYAPMGYAVVDVPATGSPERVFTKTLLTVNEATTITASSCWIVA
ncbi:DUF4307 domain-containing protein [Canibacter zhoujuaniae]|uniref:DUF4307 domain-containing protein n=1 Tax=Canibacter zhoujuaniae TaxID=2708343 RepID=UPI0014249108|nr:DUF4307 domain-containing protein [Canibacter zhoujuaniae]